MEISRIQSNQIMSFLELKKNIELENEKEIKKLIRDMINIGIELETAQAHDKVKVLLNPIDMFA
jgi:uncharacterized protein YajQ (UPF0234 family)